MSEDSAKVESEVYHCQNCNDPIPPDDVFEELGDVAEREGLDEKLDVVCAECGIHARFHGEYPNKPKQEGLDAF